MNVLIISRGIPSKDNPTWGNFELEQAEAISKLGHKVSILSVDTRTRIHKRRIGISVSSIGNIDTYSIFIPLPYSLFPPRFRAFIVDKISLFFCSKIKDFFRLPDIIHAHYLLNIPIAVSFGHAMNVPVVATEHWSKVNRPILPRLVSYLGGKYYKQVDQLITVSKSLRDTVYRNFGVESIVIDNMCATDVFAYCQDVNRGRAVTSGEFVFLAVGRIDYNKGYDVLIEAFHRAQLGSSVSLEIIGAGRFQKPLVKKVKRLGLQRNVKFLGAKRKNEVARIMQRSQAFCLTSRSETFGVVYIEAMAAGLPVIATRVGAVEDFVNDGNGILVDVENVDQTAAAMKHIYNHINEYDRLLISKSVRGKYSPETIAKKIEAIYLNVIG